MRRLFHPLAAVSMAIVLGASVWATCVEAAQPTKMKMACCEHGHNGCALGGKAADCCKTSAQGFQGFIGTEKTSPQAPALLAHVVIEGVDMVDASWHQTSPLPTPSPPHPKHPTYVLLSTLRL